MTASSRKRRRDGQRAAIETLHGPRLPTLDLSADVMANERPLKLFHRDLSETVITKRRRDGQRAAIETLLPGLAGQDLFQRRRDGQRAAIETLPRFSHHWR